MSRPRSRTKRLILTHTWEYSPYALWHAFGWGIVVGGALMLLLVAWIGGSP